MCQKFWRSQGLRGSKKNVYLAGREQIANKYDISHNCLVTTIY